MDEEILEQEVTGEEGLEPQGETPGAEAVEAPPAEDHRQEIEDFLEAFPGVAGEDIPPQVWELAAGGMELMKAYALYENRVLREELAALKQNGENGRRSLGSLGSSQAIRGGSSIEEYWDTV